MHFVLELKARMIKKFIHFVKKRKVLLGVGLLIVIILVALFFWSQRATKNLVDKENETTQKKTSDQVQENLTGKEAQTPSSSSATATTTPTTPTVTPASPTTTPSLLTDVSLQALKNQDGTLGLSLYGPQGIYSIQKCSAFASGQCTASWATIVSSQSYSGHGGLAMEALPVTETTATYLIYKMAGGQKVSASKPITVDRAVVSDVKTFTGE